MSPSGSSDVNFAAAIFHSFLSRPAGVDIVQTLWGICQQSGQGWEFLALQGAGPLWWCLGHSEIFLHLPFYQTSRQHLSAALLAHPQCLGVRAQFFVLVVQPLALEAILGGCASFVCRGWEGSLLSFSPGMRILRLLPSSGSTLAVFFHFTHCDMGHCSPPSVAWLIRGCPWTQFFFRFSFLWVGLVKAIM